jgi:hypothetical protein
VLPPFIISEIRRREQEERQRQEQRPVVEAPLPRRPYSPPVSDEDGANRGVVIIDIGG